MEGLPENEITLPEAISDQGNKTESRNAETQKTVEIFKRPREMFARVMSGPH